MRVPKLTIKDKKVDGGSIPGNLCPWLEIVGTFFPLVSLWNYQAHKNSRNTGVSSLSLLQGFFPIQGMNPGLPHCRQILYQLSHKGSPTILEWVAYPFSSGSSQPRNQTGVSCIAGGFFTRWAIREEAAVYVRATVNSSCPLLPPLRPQVHSLRLHLYSFPASGPF